MRLRLIPALCLLAVTTVLTVQTQARAAQLKLGEPAPDFKGTAADETPVQLSQLRGKVVVLECFNFGCPFVQKHYRPGAMQALQQESKDQGVVWLSVNSTNSAHRDYRDAAQTKADIEKYGIKSSHVLIDGDGSIGKQFEARTTPHIFVINAEGTLVYQGAIDDAADFDSDPKSAKNFVREALRELKAGSAVTAQETKPYGCSVKYGA